MIRKKRVNIVCKFSLFLFLLQMILLTAKSVNSNLRHITCIVAIFLSVVLQATNINNKRLASLLPLVDYDLSFNTDSTITADSVILWEKLLSPKIERQKKYEVLFPLKMMAVQALTAKGNISLAINNAHLMYQQAKILNYPFGIALALRALGQTYQYSGAPQAAIDSYEESLKVLQNSLSPSRSNLKTGTFLLILIKLKNKRYTDAEKDILYLQSLYKDESNTPNDFYLPCCYAYYYIQTNDLAKATEYLAQMDTICKKYSYPYYITVDTYMNARYYIQSKQYEKALLEYDKLLGLTKKSGLSRHIILLQERAEILELMGERKEACEVYETVNNLKDSLDAQSYLKQINELHALYQVDKSELNYINIQKNIFYWSLFIILFIVVLILFAIFHIKRNNNRLLQSQRELKKAKKQAEKSIRTKSLFLSNMSHEIRTPLNALSGFSAILTEEAIDNETKKQCNEIIQQNSELLLKLINDVIDLSSLEFGKMTFNLNKCDVVDLCQNIIDMVEKIKQTNATVLFSTSLQQLELMTDNARLQQVLINLLINATKFTSEGSITLSLEKQTEETALFSVSDTGCGITKDNQSKIFNRFEKLDENAQGTGLGLSICQLIIEQLGGKIWIDPDYDKGARFLFTHPIINKKSMEGGNK